jgi:hypothetical protein
MMAGGEAEDRARVKASAEVDADGNVSTETDAYGLFELVAELGGVVGV